MTSHPVTPHRDPGTGRTRWWALASAIGLAALAFGGAVLSGNGAVEASSASAGALQADPAGAPSNAIANARADHAGEPVSLSAASEAVSIEMYSASWCTACSQAKTWMREQNIQYHEIDIDRGGAMGQLALLNPRRTIPTFDVNGQVLVGFRPAELTNAIQDAAR